MLFPMGENSTLPVMGDIMPGDMNSACITAHVSTAVHTMTENFELKEAKSVCFPRLKHDTGHYPNATPQHGKSHFLKLYGSMHTCWSPARCVAGNACRLSCVCTCRW